ncbi:MAG: DNA polymerase III subunit gamma/tau [Rubripirellula sp.]
MSADSSQPSDPSSGGYVVVARRYRPRGFDELVGQEHVGRALKNAIETGRVGHAYLFTGARGVGKTSTARIFAKALNDPSGPTAAPDNETDVAQAIDSGEDVDVIEIDGASNRGIDEIRSLRANVGVRPSRSRYKIYIIDEVHMLTQAAFNALLKTLEEPPEHVKFIFCTTDPEKIPITVLSRCQRFDFAPVEVPKIVQRLQEIVTAEKAEADSAALELIARRASGSMRDSQSLLEQVLSFSDGKLTADQVHTMLGTADDERLHALAKAMADRDAAESLRQLDAGIDAGVDAGRLAEQLLGYFRDLMAVTVGCDASLMRHASLALHPELKELGERWGLQTVLAVVGLIDQTLVRIRHSVYSRVLLESTLIQICNLPDLQHIADLASVAGSLGATGTQKKKPVSQRPGSPSSRTEESGNSPQVGSAPSSSQATPSGSPAVSSSPDSTAPAYAASPGVAVMEPEVAQKPEVAQASVSEPVGPWDQAAAEKVWRNVLSQLESSMTEAFARVVQKVQATEKTLRLVFPAEASLAMKRCELPEHKTVLSDAVEVAAGRPIGLEFVAAPPVAKVKVEKAAAPKTSPMQRMKEIESNELVKACIELFDAEIVRIEKSR